MEASPLVFQTHAIRRMFQRRMSREDVRHVLAAGAVIEEYSEDTPYPSRLILGWCASRPLHIVIADNIEGEETVVITVYEPDSDQWEAGFRRKKL